MLGEEHTDAVTVETLGLIALQGTMNDPVC